MVAKAKEIGKISLANANADDMGVYSWLWAKCSEFVVSKGMETTVSIDLGNAASGANGGDSTNVLKASLKHFGDWWSFMECLNLFLLFATALGITSTVVLAEFYESWADKNKKTRGGPGAQASRGVRGEVRTGVTDVTVGNGRVTVG